MEGLFMFGLEVVAIGAFQILSKKLKADPTFVPFSKENMDDTLVVDCFHPSCLQLTHHLKRKGQKELNDMANRGDSSTDTVINAIKNKSVYVSNHKFVSTNHFDVDSFLSVWCVMNQLLALKYEKILRETAKIGDFRELSLKEDWQYVALRLACWLNSEERNHFFRPFEGKGYRVTKTINAGTPQEKKVEIEMDDESRDETNKLYYFLPLFRQVLISLASDRPDPIYLQQSDEEYQRVLHGYNLLHSSTHNNESRVQKYPHVSLVIIRTPEPLHYYSLFSVTHGLDIVLSMYSNNRYELETKYTTQVDLESRPVLPRVDHKHLVKIFNKLEAEYLHNLISVESKYYTLGHKIIHREELEWRADKFTESGPILRLETKSYHLTKAERYGHPDERPIYSSLIPPDRFQAIILSYYTFVYEGVQPRKDWETAEYIEFNRAVDDRIHTWKYE